MSNSGIDPRREQVHGDVDDVEVAGALAVAEQRALDAVGAGHDAELGGGHAGAAVVVRVQADDHGVAVADRAAEPLDHVAVHVRRVALDGRRQVEDQRAIRRRLDDVHHRLADVDGELRLGEREALRRVLVAHGDLGDRVLQLLAQPGGADGDVDDAVLVQPEHDLALQRVGRVVEVDDRLLGPGDALVGPLDQFLAALHQHLDRHVVGDQVLLDQLADEVEVGLAGRGEADLDLLEAHLHQGLEHAHLALGVHRVDQRLVAVAQVDAAPQGCLVDRLVRPGAVGEVDRPPRLVLLERHLLRGGGLGRHVSVLSCSGSVAVSIGKMKNPPAEAAGGRRASASVRRLPYIRRSRPARNIAAQSDGGLRRCQPGCVSRAAGSPSRSGRP